MAQLSAYQQHVSDFITGTVRQAFADIAEAVNRDAVFSATVQPSETANGLGKVSLIVRAPRHSDKKLVTIFVFVVMGIRAGDSASVWFEGEPVQSGGGTYVARGDLEIAGVPVVTDATVQQVRAHVLPLVEEAIAGYRERSQQYSGS